MEELTAVEGGLLSVPPRICWGLGEQGDGSRLVMMCRSSSDLASRGDKLDLSTDLIWHTRPPGQCGAKGREDEEEDEEEEDKGEDEDGAEVEGKESKEEDRTKTRKRTRKEG